jgi:hypothetical protein
MSAYDVEVVWPLHRSHYLSPALADAGIDMETEPESSEDTTSASVAAATHGRQLAGRALLAGGCSQQRVAELLDTSRRTVGRMVEADVAAALRDADVVAQARQYLEQSASRGMTTQEREAATAWLEAATQDSTSIDVPATTRPAGRAHIRSAPVHPSRPSRNGTGGRATVTRAKPVAPAKTRLLPPPANVALDQVDALTRQQPVSR